MKQITLQNERFFPSKVVCVGRNYMEHIRELQNEVPEEIVLFLKPNSSISDGIRFPQEKCRFETEIVYLWGESKVIGVGLGLDLTLVDVQNRLKSKGLPWEKAKAFDHSAVLSSFVPWKHDVDTSLSFRMYANGVLQQEGSTEQMIHPPSKLLQEIQQHFSLEAGDLLFSGTPQGVGILEREVVYSCELWQGDVLLLQETFEMLANSSAQ